MTIAACLLPVAPDVAAGTTAALISKQRKKIGKN
jgi:hypothetical protein